MIKKRGKAALPGKAMVTYPFWIKLRTFLAMQDPHSGLTEEKLESNHLSRGAGKPSQNRVAPLPGIDVENLSKEDMIERPQDPVHPGQRDGEGGAACDDALSDSTPYGWQSCGSEGVQGERKHFQWTEDRGEYFP